VVNDDLKLLRRYASEGCELAFRELLQRHADLVYAVALRRLNGRQDLAEEVAQQVFIDLSRKAAAIPSNTILAGWLHRHALYVSATALRAEARRLNREKEAHSMTQTDQSGDTLLDQLGTDLDEALDELPAADRDALILRFLERRDLRSVGAVLGLTDDAAQKRIGRALEKLRAIFARRGYAVSTLSLGALLTQAATVNAPATFVASTTAAAGAAASATALVSTPTITGQATAPLLLMTKAKIAFLALLAVGVSTPIVLQHRNAHRLTIANQNLRDELERLRGERDALNAASEQLRANLARAQTNQNELVRLRGEVTRLRHDLVSVAQQAGNLAKSRADEPKPADPNQTRFTPYTSNARVSLDPGQTLIMGGWPSAAGKRTLALLTPTANADGNQGQVGIESVYVEVPEAVLAGPGWEAFQSASKDAAPNGVFASGQAKQFMAALEKLEGVNILAKPKIATISGNEATIKIGDTEGAGLDLILVPVVAADGRTVDLSVTNSLRVLPDRLPDR